MASGAKAGARPVDHAYRKRDPAGLDQASPPALPEAPAVTSSRSYFCAASRAHSAGTSFRAASIWSTFTAMEGPSMWKNLRAAALVSEKPNPSAPREP